MDRKLGGLVFALFLSGCSTAGTSVPIGNAGSFAPTQPASIVLLVGAPERKHEIIALVEGQAATDDYLTKAKTEAAAIEAMKKEAARLGAHAIVLTGKGSAPYGQIGFANTTGSATTIGGYTSGYATTVGTTVGWEKITFSGTAIRYTD
jgi:hypothetical protein